MKGSEANLNFRKGHQKKHQQNENVHPICKHKRGSWRTNDLSMKVCSRECRKVLLYFLLTTALYWFVAFSSHNPALQHANHKNAKGNSTHTLKSRAKSLNDFAYEPSITLDLEPNGKKMWLEIVTWTPRAFLIHNLLSSKESAYMIEKAKLRMKKSTLEVEKHIKFPIFRKQIIWLYRWWMGISDVRTSSGANLREVRQTASQ